MKLKKNSDGAHQMLLSTSQIGMKITQQILKIGNVSKLWKENGGMINAQSLAMLSVRKVLLIDDCCEFIKLNNCLAMISFHDFFEEFLIKLNKKWNFFENDSEI